MHAAIRKYRSANVAELSRRVEEEFVPIVREVPGFVAYYVIDGGDGTVASITICQDRAGVDESTARASEWAASAVSDLMEGTTPDVTAGEVTVEHSSTTART